MKETPILYTGPMVMAILDGLKTNTRRLNGLKMVNENPGQYSFLCMKNNLGYPASEGFAWAGFTVAEGFGSPIYIKCPYGQPGDRLWVRETWADVNTPDGPAICYRADGSYIHWRDFSTQFGPDYGAGPSMDYEAYPGDYCMWWEDLLNRDTHKEDGYNWRPSIFMWRWASRIDLEITGVRVERVQDISTSDAIAEGITGVMEQQTWYLACGKRYPTPVSAFHALWDSINAKKYPWSSNPWCWVVEFKRL